MKGLIFLALLAVAAMAKQGTLEPGVPKRGAKAAPTVSTDRGKHAQMPSMETLREGARATFAMLDKDSNGKVSKQEFVASLDAHHRDIKHTHTYFSLVDLNKDSFVTEDEQWAAVQAEYSDDKQHLASLYQTLDSEKGTRGDEHSKMPERPEKTGSKPATQRVDLDSAAEPKVQPQSAPSSFLEAATINFEYGNCPGMVWTHCAANGGGGHCCNAVKKEGCFHSPHYNAHWGCCWPWDSQHLWCRKSAWCVSQGCAWQWLSPNTGLSSRQFAVGSKHYCDCVGGSGFYPFGRGYCSYGWAGPDCDTCNPYWGYECATVGTLTTQCGYAVNLMCGDDIHPDTNTGTSANGNTECSNEHFAIVLEADCNGMPR
jgi:hypothetical protein